MSLNLIWPFHEHTKHFRDSYSTGYPQAQFKKYPRLPALPLPRQFGELGITAAEALAGRARQSRWDLRTLAYLLFFSAGCTKVARRGTPFEFWTRAYPSPGAHYSSEVYLVAGALEGLEAGVYHFAPRDFALRRLRDGDHRAAIGTDGPLSLVISGTPCRAAAGYGDRGFRHLYWDAGHLIGHLLVVAGALGHKVRLQLAFPDADIGHLLDLGDPEEWPLAIVHLDHVAHRPETRQVPALGHVVERLSRSSVEYPALRAAQRAGDIASWDEAYEWGARGGGLDLNSAPGPFGPLVGGHSLEETVLCRGSTRQFGETPLALSHFEFIMAAAHQPVDADFLLPGATTSEALLNVHRVVSLDAGAYRWVGGKLELVRTGDFRAVSKGLNLDQEYCAQSAVTLFHMADPARLSSLGERGYRAAQVEAGLISSRLALAAHAFENGATGSTFFDDEVAEHFGTTLETMLVTAFGSRVKPARRGLLPSDQGITRPT